MPGPFVVIRKFGAGMTDLNDTLVESDKLYWSRRVVRLGRWLLAEDRVQRILSKNMLDVGDHQFLVLLLVMDTEDQERLEFSEKIIISARQQCIDMGID